MLSDAQLFHFAVHGWVLQEDVFDAEECSAFRAGMDRLYPKSKTHRQTNQRIDRLMEFSLVEVDQQDYVLIQNMIPGFSS